jgi:hypothetical protein
MKNIKRLNKKNEVTIEKKDVANLFNDFMNLNKTEGGEYRYKFCLNGDRLSINDFHNSDMTAPIFLLAYIIDTEIDSSYLYTGITGDGIEFCKGMYSWKDVYNQLLEIL